MMEIDVDTFTTVALRLEQLAAFLFVLLVCALDDQWPS